MIGRTEEGVWETLGMTRTCGMRFRILGTKEDKICNWAVHTCMCEEGGISRKEGRKEGRKKPRSKSAETGDSRMYPVRPFHVLCLMIQVRELHTVVVTTPVLPSKSLSFQTAVPSDKNWKSQWRQTG